MAATVSTMEHSMGSGRYVDLQCNGYAGVDFNADAFEAEDLAHADFALRADGNASVLVTLITDDWQRLLARVRWWADELHRDRLPNSCFAGLHVEGPFLNPAPGTAGAHPAKHMLRPDARRIDELLEAGRGMIRVVTVAPEMDAENGYLSLRALTDAGVVVSAGHTAATLDELRGAIDSGLSMFTHFGNGRSLRMDRHDNIIQRVMHLRKQLHISLIADGQHIPAYVLRNYIDAVGTERSFVVTDAMAAAGRGPGRYALGPVDVEVTASGRAELVGGDGRLAGSVATMPGMRKVLQEIGLSDTECDRMMIDNPQHVLKTHTA